MRILLAILLIFNFAYCAKEKSTKEKIMQTNKNLQVYANQKDELNEKIKKTASEILQEEKSLKKYQNDIDELSSVVSNLKEKYKDSQTELNKLNSQNAAIIGLQKDIEDKIVSLISKELAFDLINTQSEKSLDSIITNEVVDVIGKNASKELAALAKNYETNQNFINEQDKKITSIKSNMQDYNKKKDELNQKQVEQNKKIDKLDFSEYLKYLKNMRRNREIDIIMNHMYLLPWNTDKVNLVLSEYTKKLLEKFGFRWNTLENDLWVKSMVETFFFEESSK